MSAGQRTDSSITDRLYARRIFPPQHQHDYEYTLPAFINGSCHIKLRKGIYLLSFDGDATLADGTVRRVRFAGHSVNRDALPLIGDHETVLLNLAYLQQ